MEVIVPLIIHVCQEAYENKTIRKDAHLVAAITAYEEYFRQLVDGQPTGAASFPKPVDRLLDVLEAALTERMELGLDDMLIPKPYSSLDDLYLQGFEEVRINLEEARRLGYTVEDVLRDFGKVLLYDRRWLRDERGVRITPNSVRPLPPGFPDEKEDDAKRVPQLLALLPKYADHPAVAAELLLSCHPEEVESFAKVYLRPLRDFPAGALGFYNDQEYVRLTLAQIRRAVLAGDLKNAYRLLDDLLRLNALEEEMVELATLAVHHQIKTVISQPKEMSEVLLKGLAGYPEYPAASVFVQEIYEAISQLAGANGVPMPATSGPGMRASPRPNPARDEISADDWLQVRVDLRGASPPIWRRLLIPATTPLAGVHRILQIAFDWEGYHLHNFFSEPDYYGPPDPYGMDDVILYDEYRLGHFLRRKGDRLDYWYDFGDDWWHQIKLEKVIPRPGGKQAVTCTGGKMAAPPEDCGGIFGYQQYLDTYGKGRRTEAYEWFVDMVGEGFDPKAFSVADCNQGLRQIKV